jgi:hypothetical protein
MANGLSPMRSGVPGDVTSQDGFFPTANLPGGLFGRFPPMCLYKSLADCIW